MTETLSDGLRARITVFGAGVFCATLIASVCAQLVAERTQEYSVDGAHVRLTNVGEIILHRSYFGLLGGNLDGEIALNDMEGQEKRIALEGRIIVGYSTTGFALTNWAQDESLEIAVFGQSGVLKDSRIVDVEGRTPKLIGDLIVTSPRADHIAAVPYELSVFTRGHRA